MKLFISGYGKMGRMIEGIILSEGLEYAGWSEDVQSVDPAIARDCVCIDFTVPDAFRANYRFLAENFGAVVVGTTGWDDIREEVVDYFKKCGTTMIWASNFSIGVNVFFAAVKYVASLVGKTDAGYSPYIVEMHHCHKKDAPSGTARSLAALVEQGMSVAPDIQSVRCGEIPGIHTVGLEGNCDRITLTHEAFSREGFARGAVKAARMAESVKGVYEFNELILNNL